jgi:phenylalanyl-tRNA synthetase beta chain
MELKEFGNAMFAEGLAYYFQNDKLVEVGVISKKQLSGFDIKQEVFAAILNWDLVIKHLPEGDRQYKAVSKFPEVRRDLALVLDTHVKFEDLRKTAFETERKLLKSVGIFDVYQGDKIPQGKKSYALSFILQDREKTLNDKVIDKTMKKIQTALEQNFKAELR